MSARRELIVSPALRAKAPPFFLPKSDRLIQEVRRALSRRKNRYNRQRIRATSLYPFSVSLIELRALMFRNACNAENGVSPDN